MRLAKTVEGDFTYVTLFPVEKIVPCLVAMQQKVCKKGKEMFNLVDKEDMQVTL